MDLQLLLHLAIQLSHQFCSDVYKNPIICELFTTLDGTDTHIEMSMIRLKIRSAVDSL